MYAKALPAALLALIVMASVMFLFFKAPELPPKLTIRRSWKNFVKRVETGDGDLICIKMLETRVLNECEIASQDKVSGFLDGLWFGNPDNLFKIKDLGPTGQLCNELLSADREILALLKRFEEFEFAQAPLSHVHIKIVEAHAQILDNIECAVVYLQADGCLNDCAKSLTDEHYSNIRKIRESNEAIVMVAEELAEKVFDLMLSDFVKDRSNEMITDLRSTHSALETLN